MDNQNRSVARPRPVKDFFAQETVQAKFKELLGKRSTSFVTSILQIVAMSDALEKAEPVSIYNAACVAAVLDLPLNPNLGFAWIIPYNINTKQRDQEGNEIWKTVAQFQMGYKGFWQLSTRSGQFKTINVDDVREGEIIGRDRMTGAFTFNWILDDNIRLKKKVVGYFAYFKLINGFEKMLYMTVPAIEAHGQKYSKTFASKSSIWKTDFSSMASKTVIKLLLSRYAPLSVEMQKAIIVDQALINDENANEVTYVDGSPDEEAEELILQWDSAIRACATKEEFLQLQESNKDAIDANPFIQQLFSKAAPTFAESAKERGKLLTQQTELLLKQQKEKQKENEK